MDKLDQVFYSAVGELTGIWVKINGERYLFSKESIIREQIAREIEQDCQENHFHQGVGDCSPAAAIARGDN